MALEKTLRDLAAAGELTYLSIVPVAGPGGVVFSATFSSASKWGHSTETHADPVQAALDAIAAVKLPKRKAPKVEVDPLEGV